MDEEPKFRYRQKNTHKKILRRKEKKIGNGN